MHTILVLGGYGFFGQRICTKLASTPSVRLLIGGRDALRAAAAAQSMGLPVDHGTSIDANGDQLAARLEELQVDTLVHTAGPFQGQAYTVARAAIDAECHYIDLADGREFVAGIDCLDALARARGVTVISGASSVPALSSAVVDRYREQFARLDSIQIGISSGARVPGLATVQGVFGYAGKPFLHWSKGRWDTAYGWLGLQRHRFPKPLGSRWVSYCDVPDLQLFPTRYSGVSTVSFRAGFASDLGHLVVWSLAALVRARALRSVRPWAVPLSRISRWMEPILSDQGGMFVTLDGVGHDGQPRRTTWNLLARHNHGPYIPCGAAIALARRLAAGPPLPVGAKPCVGLLTVDEFIDPLRELDIQECVE